MSTLKVDAIRHNSATSDAITTAADGTCTAKITGMTGGGALSHRNLIINGECLVAQRGQVTGVSDGFGGPDRFRFQSNYSAVTMSQSTDVPTGQGFAKSLKLDVTTAGGISNASTYTQIDYRFEGQELVRLKYGTSSAETTTLCFWIKSPKAGTHWVRLYGDELSASSGSAFISRKYTVSSANTWQKVTLKFPGYTSDGFDNDNTTGMRISWYFAQGSAYTSGTAQADDGGWLDWGDVADRARNSVGQVNCFDSTSNDIYLTGVQLEVGDTATSFEHRSIGEELHRCKRYCQVYKTDSGGGTYTRFASGIMQTTSSIRCIFYLNPEMRTIPSATKSGNFQIFPASGLNISNLNLESGTSSLRSAILHQSSGMSGTAGSSHYFSANDDATAKVTFDAEL